MSDRAGEPGATQAGHVLVVDDDEDMCAYLAAALPRQGFRVSYRVRPEEALEVLPRDDTIDVVLTDLNMRGLSGIELCRRVRRLLPGTPVVVLTAFGSTDSAFSAIQAGAYDFLTKPFEVEVLALVLRRAVEHHALVKEVEGLRRERTRRVAFGELLGESPAMRDLFHLVERVAVTDSAVLICGETGTGKELVATELHRRSSRGAGKFVAVNCAALPEGLLESELFGHVRGAFTGAVQDRRGLLVEADHGTLFLDEVGDMPTSLQAKLLRVLQDGRVRPVGASQAQERSVDVRVVAATHRDLEAALEEGKFREDLYFRLNVIRVDLPPLRARGHDVLLLAQAFLAHHAAKLNKGVLGISSEAAEKLLGYDWPGNVRELQNCMERAVALTAEEQVGLRDLPANVAQCRPEALNLIPTGQDPTQLPTLDELERRYGEHVLRLVQGNKTLAAKVLGLDRRTLYRKLERWRLDHA